MIDEVAVNPVSLPALDAAWFDADGRTLVRPAALVQALGADPAVLAGLDLCAGGVQTAPAGAIQDPAGSAIGSGRRPDGGGASGAIYAAFPDLAPIPAIRPRSAICNASDGPGRRVLHSHSPQLAGRPDDPAARRQALEDIANTYANAVVAFVGRSAGLGDDGQRLNLVPVSAAIFAGDFRRTFAGEAGAPPVQHLDPGYTLAALALAVSALAARGHGVPALSLYCFAPPVLARAQSLLADWP